MLSTAIRIASEVFENVDDKGGAPYILHCLCVMNQMDPTDHELMSIAVLHDVIEDSGYSFNWLRNKGFSERVIDGVKALTHKKDVPYMDYIRNLAHNPDARKVKMADLRHNSDIMRMKGLREKDFKRLEEKEDAETVFFQQDVIL